jgi:hypothetical protein
MRQSVLRPGDVVVAVQLALEPGLQYQSLAEKLRISIGEAHNAVRRLRQGRLISNQGRRVVKPALLEFLIAGVPHAFPAALGSVTRGIPTAHAAPPLSEEFPVTDPVVWPIADGAVRGESLVPLYPNAPLAARANPALHRLLALADALRIGRARERQRAKEHLREALLAGPTEFSAIGSGDLD